MLNHVFPTATPGSTLVVNTLKLKAKVVHGRLVVDAPTDSPDGTVFELVLADGPDELDDEQPASTTARAVRPMINALIRERVREGAAAGMCSGSECRG